MKTIWKFPLSDGSPQQINMPIGAEVLTVQTQNKLPCIWAIVDPAAATENRYFEVFGTGEPLHGDMGVERKYIGTLQQPPHVWHLFERL